MKGSKKKAWDWFSKYIRLRDAIETTGTSTHFWCPTCGKKLPYEQGQAGHSIGGRGNSILLHEEIVHCQCSGCNAFGGQYAKYSVFMIEKYGLDAWKEFVILSKQPKTIKEFEWKELSETYKQKFEGLRSLGL